MQYQKGICEGNETNEGCGKYAFIANRTKRLCIDCNEKRLNNAKVKVQKLPKGELQLFIEIWNERPRISEVSGIALRDFNPCNFSHILTKGAYPRYRLNKENIVLKTFYEHQEWEFRAHTLKDKPEWKWVFEKKEKLKQEYYAGKKL